MPDVHCSANASTNWLPRCVYLVGAGTEGIKYMNMVKKNKDVALHTPL